MESASIIQPERGIRLYSGSTSMLVTDFESFKAYSIAIPDTSNTCVIAAHYKTSTSVNLFNQNGVSKIKPSNLVLPRTASTRSRGLVFRAPIISYLPRRSTEGILPRENLTRSSSSYASTGIRAARKAEIYTIHLYCRKDQ